PPATRSARGRAVPGQRKPWTFGLLLLGIALWRSRVAPAWMGIALGLGGFTHPFLPGHVLAGLGLLVAAVGFAGASWALLRTSNDDFDLPRCHRPNSPRIAGRRRLLAGTADGEESGVMASASSPPSREERRALGRAARQRAVQAQEKH
ncbi:MAG TPA: hypothetical protein VFR46_04940, partial [Actinomycetes bacterium]|nr:hypothetical protein [Actinomycetes bacterium]